MAFAVIHVLASIIIVDLYRDYFTHHKKYFTLHTLFIAGIGGLLPDIDIPLNWVFSKIGFEIAHRTFTHTPLFGLVFLVPGLILWKYKHHKKAVYFFVLCLGVLLHLLLDGFFISNIETEGIMLFYPFSEQVFGFNIFYNELLVSYGAAIDAFILIFWLWWEERRHKIKDFL